MYIFSIIHHLGDTQDGADRHLLKCTDHYLHAIFALWSVCSLDLSTKLDQLESFMPTEVSSMPHFQNF